jgi:hypothetical protein
MSNEDHFEDVRSSGELGGYGVLGGDAITSHQKAVAKLSPDRSGIDYHVNCDHCGTRNKLSVTWAEFVFAANNQIPYDQVRQAPWKHERQFGGFQPNVGCGHCQYAIMLIITPDEAARHLHGAEQAGAIPKGWYQAQSQALRQRAVQGYQR